MKEPGDQRDTRREYQGKALRRLDLDPDPLKQFGAWMDAAVAAGVIDATAMALATVAADGTPSVRIVLLKHFDAAGFCWYGDDRSQKGRELADNPVACALFYWRELSRQVRITGDVERLSPADVDAYFESRPDESRFSAAASVQSAPIADRETLEARVADLQGRHPDGRVPRPPEWGGYRLRATGYEFWQGRKGRLHDRFRYSLADGVWQVERLQP